MRRVLLLVALWGGCDDEGAADGRGAMDAVSPVDARAPVDAAADAERDATTEDATLADAAPEPDAAPPPRPYPPPDGWTPNRGPGGPAVAFTEDQLWRPCAELDPGPDDRSRHRNLVTMYDGYLLMPWSPEFGLTGGLTFFDVRDPCDPVKVGHGTTDLMRESHSIGFSHLGGRWAVVTHQEQLLQGGALFWDLSDIEHPTVAGALKLPGFLYPDAYARVVLSVFWQVPYVYVGGADNGVYIIDATDPTAPEYVGLYAFEPTLRVGQVQVIGDLLVATSAEGTRTVLLDVSDPTDPRPIPGGDFVQQVDGEPVEAYFSNTANGFVYYARKSGGGGVFAYDIRDPTRPTYAGGYRSDGNGGYVFVHKQFAFVGESRFGQVYDLSDMDDVQVVGQVNLAGDLDTVTPIGNVAVVAVDDKAEEGVGTVMTPWRATVDAEPPVVTWAWPADGATGLAATSRFGVTFDEFVDPRSAWEGSVRLYEAEGDPARTRVDGHASVQENILNFWPARPLKPNTTYVFEIPAGGVVDFNGNAVAEDFRITVTTGAR